MSLPPELSEPRLLRLWEVLPEARVVGGAVRDFFAGLPIADIDLATPRTPGEVGRALEAAGVRMIPTGLAHGTITALVEDRPFEVTTLRRDIETDGRHAVVAFTDDWQADAARRDFTFNAMSIDRDGALFDFFDGRSDLGAGRVRFVGDAATRIGEDFLRVLRFFRFFARYGREKPEPATAEALRAASTALWRLSAERLWSELRKTLSVLEPIGAIRLMRDLGVLEAVVPGLRSLHRFERLVAADAPADPLLRLAALSSADPGALAERYRMSSADADRLHALRGDAPAEQAGDLALRQALIDVGKSHLIGRTWLDGRGDTLRRRIEAMPDLVFPVQGRDLLELGMSPGPAMGRRLAQLRACWRDGGGVATREELLGQLAPPPGG